MRVRMLIARSLQEAGCERPLSADREYDLSEVVAISLVATGAAKAVRPVEDPSADVCTAAVAPPEGRLLGAPETKIGRSRR